MNKRFEFEQAILGCWNITDELNLIADSMLEQDLDKEQVVNMLIGLALVYHLKFEKTFRTFEEAISEKH